MEFCQKFRVFQIVLYQLNYISKDPRLHLKTVLDHFEQSGTIFNNFEQIPQNSVSNSVFSIKGCNRKKLYSMAHKF